ncbi:hypothetical protein AmDm5_2090 [Acetobacter malorum]|nr:hypothetical protein AmDm5_2090 [Acetobacter malorum]
MLPAGNTQPINSKSVSAPRRTNARTAGTKKRGPPKKAAFLID